MTVYLPPPVPLEPPPGEPSALADIADGVASAGFRLGEIAAHLAGPAAAAPGWLGADATAAAAQVAVVASLAREGSDSLAAAAARLAGHRFLLLGVRGRVGALRREQEDDFAAAEARLASLIDYAAQVSSITDEPEAVAVVAELRAAEARRGREHARLLDEVADDAAATGRVLADASAVVGGTGRRGDAGRAVAHLATVLPGWGDAELTARAAALVEGLVGGPATPEERERLAQDALGYAGTRTFADALLAGLGSAGVGYLLASLAHFALGPHSPLARLLASAFGAAVPTGRPHDPVGAVLTATYIHPDDRYGDGDVAAAGLAAVLVAGRSAGGGGVRTDVVAAWGRQMLARERVQGIRAGAGAVPPGWDPATSDALGLVTEILAARGEPEPSAALLADRRDWDVLFARFWADGGAALGEVVGSAAAVPGPPGEAVVRSALGALGSGLGDEGDPAHWTVDRDVAAALAPSLAAAAAVHVGVVTDVLAVGVDGRLTGGRDDVLRGLGYLTQDRGAAAVVGRAVAEWAGSQPVAPTGRSVHHPLPALAVPSAYLAVQEYGQRLAHALHGFEAQHDAENKALFWRWTYGLGAELLGFAPGPLGKVGGPVADLLQGYGALWLDMDGTWHNGVDRGLRFDRADAPAPAAYDRTLEALGEQRPPAPPEKDWSAPASDAMADLSVTRLVNLPGPAR